MISASTARAFLGFPDAAQVEGEHVKYITVEMRLLQSRLSFAEVIKLKYHTIGLIEVKYIDVKYGTTVCQL
jgi:hypothetical protein